MKLRHKAAAAAAAALLSCWLCGCRRQEPEASSSPAPQELSLPTERPSPGYREFPVYFDGLLMDQGCIRDGEMYLSPGEICSYLGIAWSWNGDESAFTISLDGTEFGGSREDGYLSGNGRYFYAPEGWFTAGDKLYLSYELLCRFLCLDVQPEEGSDALYLSTLNARVIPGGEDYYELYFPSEELFWLSQIIHAEAWQQPLAGQIGVGNVVLNRVDSPDFPSTVFDVIFDMDHNIIQFEPISNGSVYSQPDEMARIAACLCLEGYNTVGDSLYFVNPAFGSGWFDSSLDLTVTIGDHNFYSVRGA